ncbi:MAG TPA: hypothetical protein VHV78_06105, partial [Gemmatimonadaceae bacterium]|nr:hypothetical protein [Gemmatimonadaceae bacterium]
MAKKYHCLYSTCTEYKKVVEAGQFDPTTCSVCGKQMASAEQPAAPAGKDFLEAAAKVEKAVGGSWSTSYMKKVVVDVTRRPSFYQQDFVTEMKGDPSTSENLKKFIGTAARSSDPGTICVDNAFRAAGKERPSGVPSGEKFTFEL